MRQKPRPYQDRDDDENVLGDELVAVNERLDELTRHIERIAQTAPGWRNATAEGGGLSADRVAEALARLDRRLDQVIDDQRAAPALERRARAARPESPPIPPPPPSDRSPANWAAQIAARQRALDGEASPEIAPSKPQPLAPAFDLAGLEQELRDIRAQIASLQQPCQDGFAALRGDLAEVGRTLTEAAPRRAVEALEAQVGSLAESIDRGRQSGADTATLARLEQGLAEVRDALRGLTPAENVAGIENAVRDLSQKIDQIASSGDPAAFKQLEQAVVSLQGVMSNMASEGALTPLATPALTENRRSTTSELEQSMRSLSERIDRVTLGQGDQVALASLEDRIAKLCKKLDTTDARLGHLDAIERGMADMLVHLEEMRGGGSRDPAAAPRTDASAEAAPAPPHVALAAPAVSPLDLIPAATGAESALATPPPQSPPGPALASALPLQPSAPIVPASALVTAAPPAASEPSRPPAPVKTAPPAAIEPSRPPAPVQAAPSAGIKPSRPYAKQTAQPRPEPRRPIDPNLPPDTPIEPGAGVPRVRTGSSAAARIAASEAALSGSRLMAEEVNIKSAAIAAARNAVKSTYLDVPVKAPRSTASNPVNLFSWFGRTRSAQPAPPAPRVAPEPPTPPASVAQPASEGGIEGAQTSRSPVLKRLKTLLIAASVGIIVVAAVQTTLDLLLHGDPVVSATIPLDAPASSKPDAPENPTPGESMPILNEAPPAPPAPPVSPPSPDTTGAIGAQPSLIESAGLVVPQPPPGDVAGSAVRPSARTAPAGPTAAVPPKPTNSVLHTAIAAHDPAAEYELASRYAEGRSVPQDLHEATRWFERAANAGFVPAQFQLAGLNEKGVGLKKDVQAARRLYLSAANKGHAKAMHNLAVLYAEGIDGRPDYQMASQWFRKAAAYGIADSQYNLAILYARGIGVETSLAESYKWFAVAAAHGDRDAAKKRDEVAARLDPQTLAAAKLAVATFAAEREPEDAIGLRVPPGGWDLASAPPVKPGSRGPASSRR